MEHQNIGATKVKAAQLARIGFEDKSDLSDLSTYLLYLAATDSEHSLGLLEKEIAWSVDLWNVADLFDFYRSAWALCAVLTKNHRQIFLKLPKRFPLYQEEGNYQPEVLSKWFYNKAVKLSTLYALPIAPLQEDNMEPFLEKITLSDGQRTAPFIQAVNRGLKAFNCCTQVQHFLPMELPVLYSISNEVLFYRQLKSGSEVNINVYADALTSLLDSVQERPLGTLYLNLNKELVKRLVNIPDSNLLESVAHILYIQALLARGQQLRGSELKTMNLELVNLIDYTSR